MLTALLVSLWYALTGQRSAGEILSKLEEQNQQLKEQQELLNQQQILLVSVQEAEQEETSQIKR